MAIWTSQDDRLPRRAKQGKRWDERPVGPHVPIEEFTHLSLDAAATSGYRYAITLQHFPANADISVNCYDSKSPNGFFPFAMRTDGGGYAFTRSQCYSGDGPDHWVIAGGVASNHVTWSASSGGGGQPPGGGAGSGGTPGSHASPSPPPETCEAVSGVQAPSSHLSEWLFARFEGGYSTAVVVPWSYFTGNPQFVAKAKSIPENDEVIGWRAVFPSDMYFALGHFTIKHTSPHCYLIYDKYDFSAVQLPFWLQQKLKSAIPFDVYSSGKLE